MNTAYIHSRLAADPVLGELVEMFVMEMPNRISALETQAHSHDWAQLTRTAHQLKGAAGSYGFHDITPFAARLEHAARAGLQEQQILDSLADLLDLCRRVRAGTPQVVVTALTGILPDSTKLAGIAQLGGGRLAPVLNIPEIVNLT